MTPEPDARSVRIRSPVLGTSPSPAVYDVAKIWTTDGLTLREVDSSSALRSAALGALAVRV